MIMKTNRLLSVLFLMMLCTIQMNARRIGYYFYFEDYNKHLYEDDNVKISIQMSTASTIGVYVYNKTNKIIYVDKANCFAILNGNATNMFSNSVSTSGVSGSTGVNVNVGAVARGLGIGNTIIDGINVGGSRGNYNQTTTYEKRIVPIAPQTSEGIWYWKDPHGLMECVGRMYEPNSMVKFRSRYVEPDTRKEIKLKKGFVRIYDKNTTPVNLKAVVTYSLTEDFKTTVQATVDNYLKAFVADSYKGWDDYKAENVPYCVPFMNDKENYQLWLRYKEGSALNPFESGMLYGAGIPAAVVLLIVGIYSL